LPGKGAVTSSMEMRCNGHRNELPVTGYRIPASYCRLKISV
jgi:hypothetical protein